MARVGYARVSTPGQSLDPQLDALRKAGDWKIFEDHAGGAKTARPGLDRALAWLRDGDTLVDRKLDRLDRSMPHLIETVQSLEGRGVGFHSLTEGIDTITSGGPTRGRKPVVTPVKIAEPDSARGRRTAWDRQDSALCGVFQARKITTRTAPSL